MAPNAPNVPGITASDAEIKGKMQMAAIKHAAPSAKQTTPRPVFSAKPIVILSPASGCGHHRAGSMDRGWANSLFSPSPSLEIGARHEATKNHLAGADSACDQHAFGGDV